MITLATILAAAAALGWVLAIARGEQVHRLKADLRAADRLAIDLARNNGTLRKQLNEVKAQAAELERILNGGADNLMAAIADEVERMESRPLTIVKGEV